jgi:HSP20 family protein
MAIKKETALVPARDPFETLRQMATDFDRLFTTPGWSAFRFPWRTGQAVDDAKWFPQIDVFEKDGRLITKIDLPGMTKKDIKVEVTDGHLAISGERQTGTEEKTEHFYRCERETGSFYRAVPLPDGVKVEDVSATFDNGVLEISVPLPAKPEQKARKVEIADATQPGKAA